MRKETFGKGLSALLLSAGTLFVGAGCNDAQPNYQGNNQNQQQSRSNNDGTGRAGLTTLQILSGLYGAAGNGTVQQRNAASFASNFIGEEKRNEAISNSGTNVYVNNGRLQEQFYVPQSSMIMEPQIHLFVYDYVNDKNNNDIIEETEINKKKIIYRGERAVLSANFYSHNGENFTFRIYHDGKVMGERDVFIDSDIENKGFSLRTSNMEPGSYSGSLYSNGRNIKSTDFWILNK